MPMSAKKLSEFIVTALDDAKAIDIKVIDVRKLSSFADYMIVASGRSSRQVRGLSEKALEAARANKVKPLGTEGEATSEWILVDLGDVIVHLMQQETRAFYQLEKLWEVVPKTRKRKAATEAETE